MTGTAKRNSLLLLGLVMMITLIIAAGLPRLELKPGMPLPKLVNNQVVVAPVAEERIEAIPFNKFMVLFFILLMAGSTLYMMVRLLRGASWRDITSMILPMVFAGLIISGLLFLIMLLPRSERSIQMELPIPAPEPQARSPLGPVPPLLFWLVGLGLLGTCILIGISIVRSASGRGTTMDIVGLEAEKAWQELKAGQGLKDVIIKCYRQMSLALQKDQGIEREEYMTTGEFENLLEAAGVPYDPIHQLTRLFDLVRYGNLQPNLLDEQNAIHCLEAIVLYSRKARKMG
jgi:hypothetical protein